jgi:hypothetical protein
MILWGLPLAVFQILVLITVGKLIPFPDHISVPTMIEGLVLFFLAGCFFFVPLWWLSDRLHRNYGLVCPGCGNWLSIKSVRHMRCTRCKQKISDEG